MNPENILKALARFTERERIEFLPLAPDSMPVSDYAPIHKYTLDLKNGAKPESAAEGLFTALCKDVLGFQPTRQVGVAEGFVDFMLPERMGDPMQLELKPLFQRGGPDAIWRSDANPKNHVAQVKRYLREHEYRKSSSSASFTACRGRIGNTSPAASPSAAAPPGMSWTRSSDSRSRSGVYNPCLRFLNA